MIASDQRAPVAVFAFNRPDHFRNTMAALCANDLAGETHVVIYLDGPKSESDKRANLQIRAICRDLRGFQSVSLICRDANLGLAQSIISGVSEMCKRYGRTIVLEDDLITSPYFLRFMNDGLLNYERESRVASIHGYIYPLQKLLPETFFLRGADCWGWATWERAWKTFETDGQLLLLKLKEMQLENAFDFNETCGNTAMLQNQIEGKNNSWAIRWHASAFLEEMLTLYPGRSLVRNAGNDGSGTHCLQSACYDVPLSATPIIVERLPLVENAWAHAAFREYFEDLKSSSVPKKSVKAAGRFFPTFKSFLRR